MKTSKIDMDMESPSVSVCVSHLAHKAKWYNFGGIELKAHHGKLTDVSFD